MYLDRNPTPDVQASNLTEILLTEYELAARQNRSVKTLRNHRLKGQGVPHLKLGRTVRYRLSDVLAYEQASLRLSTSDVGGAA